MIFSKSCEYALRSVIYICSKSESGVNLSVKDIAKEINSPEPFTAKILQQLARQKIISSIKGPNGGFYIDSSNKKPISIMQIVEAVEGPDFFDRCILGLDNCSAKNPCPLHHHFITHRNEIAKLVREKSISDLVVESKKIKLK